MTCKPGLLITEHFGGKSNGFRTCVNYFQHHVQGRKGSPRLVEFVRLLQLTSCCCHLRTDAHSWFINTSKSSKLVHAVSYPAVSLCPLSSAPLLQDGLPQTRVPVSTPLLPHLTHTTVCVLWSF